VPTREVSLIALVILIGIGCVVDAVVYDGRYRRRVFEEARYQGQNMADNVHRWIGRLEGNFGEIGTSVGDASRVILVAVPCSGFIGAISRNKSAAL
jgi:hypothetical protein